MEEEAEGFFGQDHGCFFLGGGGGGAVGGGEGEFLFFLFAPGYLGDF